MNGEFVFEIASIIQEYPDNFKRLKKAKVYQVKLNSDEKSKPVAVPKRPFPYPFHARVPGSLENMIKNSVIEEHPSKESAPWVPCAVIILIG